MSAASGGLHSSSQRRGVMPLVLFWNFSGVTSKKSLKLCTTVKTGREHIESRQTAMS